MAEMSKQSTWNPWSVWSVWSVWSLVLVESHEEVYRETFCDNRCIVMLPHHHH